MAPRRRLALAALALALVLAVASAVLLGRSPDVRPADQARPGPVLLVPGYGGSTANLSVLAGALRAAGRTATLVAAAGTGTGDLAEQAEQLDAAARAALDAGAPSVDVVGYSAGGVVVRLWLDGEGAGTPVRRVVTLGSPHEGTDVARLAAELSPDQCPTACQQLVPGSPLLSGLPDTPGGGSTVWTSLWTALDEVVTPASTARLPGAVDVELQAVCPDATTAHTQLPRDPLPVGVVLRALDVAPLGAAPAPGECAALRAEGAAVLDGAPAGAVSS